jgi:hypothetical protein
MSFYSLEPIFWGPLAVSYRCLSRTCVQAGYNFQVEASICNNFRRAANQIIGAKLLKQPHYSTMNNRRKVQLAFFATEITSGRLQLRSRQGSD